MSASSGVAPPCTAPLLLRGWVLAKGWRSPSASACCSCSQCWSRLPACRKGQLSGRPSPPPSCSKAPLAWPLLPGTPACPSVPPCCSAALLPAAPPPSRSSSSCNGVQGKHQDMQHLVILLVVWSERGFAARQGRASNAPLQSPPLAARWAAWCARRSAAHAAPRPAARPAGGTLPAQRPSRVPAQPPRAGTCMGLSIGW